MNSAIEKYLKILEGNQPDKIKEAVNFLIGQSKDFKLKQRLWERIKNSYRYEDYSPLWAVVILGEMKCEDSIFELLDVLDTDEDYMIEAACDALIHIEKAWPQSVIPAIFDFILRRIDHDPFYAKISAYGILEVFIDQESVKRFLIRMFEEDEDSQDYIAEILEKTKDKRILELFKRAMEFSKQIGDKQIYNEIKWAYFYLDRGKIFWENPQDYKESWEKPWEERWDFVFKDMIKTEEEEKKEEMEAIKSLKKLKEKISKDALLTEEDKKEQREFETYKIAPFQLEKYLEIRERSQLEWEFHNALALLGLTNKWQVEQIQILINKSKRIPEVLDVILKDFMFPSLGSMEIFTSIFNRVWNNTPREEFNGLTPNQKAEILNYKK